MKRDFLKNLDLGGGTKLPDEAVDAIMAEYGRSKATLEQTISTLTTERDGLQSQLTAANDTIKGYKEMDIDGIKAVAKDWEAKYNTETQRLKDELAEAQYGYCVKDAVAGLKFSSSSAKRAFTADLTAKKLPIQDGKLLGLDDFVTAYRETDPDAFVAEGKVPEAVRGGSSGTAPTIADNLRAAFGLPAK